MSTSPVEKWRSSLKFAAQGGSWYFTGTSNLPLLSVNGEQLSFPLSVTACERLISQSSPAPFGKGTETVVDETIRTAWQIETANLELDNSWNNTLSQIIEELNNTYSRDDISLKLYKMLLYKSGGHFAMHRDTLRDKSHIASLLISLPVATSFEGGQLEVHGPGNLKDATMVWDGQCSGLVPSFCSFYTDCEHELKPVTAGYRATLAYQVYSNSALSEVVDEAVSEPITSIVDEVLRQRQNVCMLLNHSYGANVELRYLKGFDRLLVEMLVSKYGASNIKLNGLNFSSVRDVYDGAEDRFPQYEMTIKSKHIDDDDVEFELARKDPLDRAASAKTKAVKDKRKTKNARYGHYSTMYGKDVGDDEDDDDEDPSERISFFASEELGFLFNSQDVSKHEQLYHIEGAEYTGNEAAQEENVYHLTLLTVTGPAAGQVPDTAGATAVCSDSSTAAARK